MEQTVILDVGRQALMTGIMVSAPVLGTALVVGIMVSVFQSVTQVQEMTLTFVPKALCCAFALMVFGNWIVTTILALIHFCFDQIAHIAR